MANTITADEIREHFSQAMSAMYQQEVPQYGTLLELVADVNLAVLENNPQLHEQLANADELARLNVERHGAIRVGTAEELATLRRMFAIMEELCYKFKKANIPYGFGGIAALGKGDLPAEKIIIEHYRMGSTSVILSRSFCNTNEVKDIETIKSIFINGIKEIRDYEKTVVIHSEYFESNKQEINRIVDKIVSRQKSGEEK